MNPNRPVLISVAQYEQELTSGACTVFDVIEAANRLGADGVELRRETWRNMPNEVATARARIEESGLLVAFATHVTLFSADAAGQETLRSDIDTAAALGSPILRVFQGPAPADDDDAGWSTGRAAIDYAADRDIVVALENYARTPGGKIAEIRRVLDRFDTPALATNIDIANYAGHDEDVVAAIQAVGERAVYTHLKDLADDPDDALTYLGGGRLPLTSIMDALDSLPQRLFYCFEFRGGGEPEERIKKSLAYLAARG